MITLLLFAVVLLLVQCFAYVLGDLLTQRPLLGFRPFTCRPCLTFWIASLGSFLLFYLLRLHLDAPAWLLIAAGWASAAAAFALYLYTKSKYHVTD